MSKICNKPKPIAGQKQLQWLCQSRGEDAAMKIALEICNLYRIAPHTTAHKRASPRPKT